MPVRHAKQDLRVFPNAQDSSTDGQRFTGDIPTPTGTSSTPRRIVKSLKGQPSCVTQLVQLDNNQPPVKCRFSSMAVSLPSDCSVSEVRSELCSGPVDEQGEVSNSSFFDHRRGRQEHRTSIVRKDARKARSHVTQRHPGNNQSQSHSNSRAPRKRGAATKVVASRSAGRSGRDVVEESTILSYSDSASFYSCDSHDNSSGSCSPRSTSSDSCRSVSFTIIAESVPSCSLTAMGDQVTRVPATSTWGLRGRRNPAAQQRSHSCSFGSIFGGPDGIDLCDGVSIDSYHTNNISHGTSATTATLSSVAPPANSVAAALAAERCDGSGRHSSVDLGSLLDVPAAMASEADVAKPAAQKSSVEAHRTENTGSAPKPTRLGQTSRADTKPAGATTAAATATTAPGPFPPLDTTKLAAASAASMETTASREKEDKKGKQKVVTIAIESPKAARRSSLFDPETPTSTTSGDGTGAADADAEGGDATPPWRVQNVKREERIGRGSYGDVFRGIDLGTGKEIAIKEILVPKDFTQDLQKQLKSLEREIHVMRKLNHPNTINYLGAVTDENGLNIYMEFVSGGTVGELLREGGPLSETRARGYTAQLLCGLEYLHERQIVHRDLKGDNLFLTEDDVLKLGDFGTSKELVTTLVTNSVAGTPNFMAPEVIACSGHSYAADIWSVGCCVLEMLTGLPPFAKMDNHMAVMFAVMKGKLAEQIPEHISASAKDFICMCTKNEPKDRWTASQVRQHPWLQGAAPATGEKKEIPSPTTCTGPSPAAVSAVASNDVVALLTADYQPQPPPPVQQRKAATPGKASATSVFSPDSPKVASPKTAMSKEPSQAPRRNSGADSMPPLPTVPGGRRARGKAAVPLEPAALVRSLGHGSGVPHLPSATAKSPAPHSDDGEVDGTTSSDPSSNGNSPASRTKAACKHLQQQVVHLPPTDGPLSHGLAGAATSRRSSTKLSSSCSNSTHDGSARRARHGEEDSAISSRGGKRDYWLSNSSATDSSLGASSPKVASPPVGTPTGNPRRAKGSGTTVSRKIPSITPHGEKRKRGKAAV